MRRSRLSAALGRAYGKSLVLFGLTAILVLVGCSRDEATSTPTQVPAQQETATATPTTAAGDATPLPPATPTPTTEVMPKRGGTLFQTSRLPDTLDPAAKFCDKSRTQTVLSGIYEALIGRPRGPEVQRGDTTPTGYLAESWEVIDAATYRFNLRQGVRFHDKPPVNGRELTSEDVKFSLLRYRAQNECAKETQFIASIDTPDKYTVIVHLDAPFAPFIEQLATSQAWIHAEEAGLPPTVTSTPHSSWR